jgi:hypothetical protein
MAEILIPIRRNAILTLARNNIFSRESIFDLFVKFEEGDIVMCVISKIGKDLFMLTPWENREYALVINNTTFTKLLQVLAN